MYSLKESKSPIEYPTHYYQFLFSDFSSIEQSINYFPESIPLIFQIIKIHILQFIKTNLNIILIVIYVLAYIAFILK